MRKPHPLAALIPMLLASPLFAAYPDASQQAHDELEQQTQRVHEIQQRMNDRLYAHMNQLLAAAPAAPLPPGYSGQIQIIGDPAANNGRIFVRREVQTEKAPFLGVAALPAPAVLREQLKLPKGFGLVVELVEKDSPAAAAGVRVHDVLQKLDDQWIVNPQQLLILVRSKKPGDSVNITVLREGQPVTLKAELVEKELPVADENGQQPQFWSGNIQLNPAEPGALRIEPFPGNNQAPWHYSVRAHVDTAPDGTVTRTRNDNDGELSITTAKDGAATLVAKDPEGKVLFEGPYTTDEDKQKVPDNIAPKALELMRNNGHTTVTLKGPYPDGDKYKLAADNVTVTRSDADNTISIAIGDKGKTVSVKDKAGNVLYEGPADKDDDLKSLSPELQDKVKKLIDKVASKIKVEKTP